jgi:hypothetical protein
MKEFALPPFYEKYYYLFLKNRLIWGGMNLGWKRFEYHFNELSILLLKYLKVLNCWDVKYYGVWWDQLGEPLFCYFVNQGFNQGLQLVKLPTIDSDHKNVPHHWFTLRVTLAEPKVAVSGFDVRWNRWSSTGFT